MQMGLGDWASVTSNFSADAVPKCVTYSPKAAATVNRSWAALKLGRAQCRLRFISNPFCSSRMLLIVRGMPSCRLRRFCAVRNLTLARKYLAFFSALI